MTLSQVINLLCYEYQTFRIIQDDLWIPDVRGITETGKLYVNASQLVEKLANQ